jgi:hypothetical protein
MSMKKTIYAAIAIALTTTSAHAQTKTETEAELKSGAKAAAKTQSDAELQSLRAQVEALKAQKPALPDASGALKAAQDEVAAARAQAAQAAEALKQAKDQADAAVKQAKDQAMAAVKQAKEEAMAAANAAKNEAARQALGLINSKKYVKLSFGVLPNSDRKANNLISLDLNYLPELSSRAAYLNRNLGNSATLEATKPAADGLPEIRRTARASSALEETKIELTLLRYEPEALTFGSAHVKPGFGIGVDQLRNNSSRFIVDRQSFADPRSGVQREVVSTVQVKEQTVATLPNIAISVRAGDDHGFNFDFGAGILIANRETYSWEERGTGSMPALTLDSSTEIAAQTVDLHDNHRNDFKSNGAKAVLDLAYEAEDHGFTLRGDYLGKKGKRHAYALDIASADPKIDTATGKVLNSGAKTVTTSESTVEESLTQAHGALGWKMKFLKRYGIVPELSFNAGVDRLVTTDNGQRKSDVSRLYALGILLDY